MHDGRGMDEQICKREIKIAQERGRKRVQIKVMERLLTKQR